MNFQPAHCQSRSIELSRFAIDETIRALDRQVAAVERLRFRAFAFVGFATTAKAFRRCRLVPARST